VTDPAIVDALIVHVQAVPARSHKRQRQLRWWFFFVVALVGFATGVAGFVGAVQQERTQLVAFLLLVLVAALVVVRIFLMRRPAPVVRWQPLSYVQPQQTWVASLVHDAHQSRWDVLWGRSIRIMDFMLWMLMAVVLVCAAATIFIFSAFGLYDGLMAGIDIFDVVLVIGLVGPFMSIQSGIARWRARRDGSRKRLNSFTETLRNALGAINNFFNTTLDTTAGMVRAGVTNVTSTVSTSIVTVTTTAALSATVAGVGLAAVDVAPRSIIATGRVLPLPMEVATLAGAEGKDVGLRGEILLNCMDDILAGNEDNADVPCQTAVHAVGSVCATWDGNYMPASCEAQIFALLPEIQPLVQNNDQRRSPRPENTDTSDPNNEQQSKSASFPTTTSLIVATPTASAMMATLTSVVTPIPTDTVIPVATTVPVDVAPVVDTALPPNMTQMPDQGTRPQGTPIVRGPNNNAQGTPIDTPLPRTGNQPSNP